MAERTAQQEYDFLISREEHRKPIDAFFRLAINEIKASGAMDRMTILELGPGPLIDLQTQLNGVHLYARADTRPADGVVTALEPLWSAEQRLPYRDGAFNHVLAREVFEHVFHLHAMLREVWRVLAPGGQLWFSTPFFYLLHDYEDELGGDWWRLSPKGWLRLLAETGFTASEVKTPRHLWDNWQCPITVLGWARK